MWKTASLTNSQQTPIKKIQWLNAGSSVVTQEKCELITVTLPFSNLSSGELVQLQVQERGVTNSRKLFCWDERGVCISVNHVASHHITRYTRHTPHHPRSACDLFIHFNPFIIM